MTPKEKAKELVSKFTFLKTPEDNAKFYNPKQCALICVDEILGIMENWQITPDPYFQNTHKRWNEVKQEIEKI